jgi:toxin YoeB
MLQRINTLIREIQREPYKGVGSPEPLRHGLTGYWSRRISEEHRLVYGVEEESIFIVQLRYHY